MPGPRWRQSWHGAAVSSARRLARNRRHVVRRKDLLGANRRRHNRRELRHRALWRLGGFGELHRPGLLLAGVDLKEAGPIEAAGKTIVNPADRELFIARAHEGLAGPFPAVV